MQALDIPLDVAPYRLSGNVYGALLNDPAQLRALGAAVDEAPHKAAPRAPVLAVMPRHTWSPDGADLVVPAGVDGLEVGVGLGIVIGRTACRVDAAQALSFVAGYLVVGDISLPLSSHYRPAVRLRARDGFCPVGPRVTPASEVSDPDALTLRVGIDGATVHETSTASRQRGVAQLIAAVSDFMTLQAGDILSLGRSHGAPLARAGQRVTLSIAGVGTLHHRVIAEGPAA
jgi:5-oxopent-3-ene-1,2,5-tricarboxylate decarboxylase/2-hydroxyhepta-2,4-diene-1,7-dioate isomerase